MQKGVMYIGHLPHGFYEKELKKFFSQFGKVTRLRVCRSKKTGGCKGFGFIEFECEEVANIAAETMNNYLMYEKLLKCHVIPSEEVPRDLFKNTISYQNLNFVRQRRFHNSQKTAEQDEKRKKKAMKKLENIKKKLDAMGIQYTYKIGKSLKRVSFSEDIGEKHEDKVELAEIKRELLFENMTEKEHSNRLKSSNIKIESVFEKLTENEDGDKIELIDTINSTTAVAINSNTMTDKTSKRRSPKDRACKRKQSCVVAELEEKKDLPLICTPEYKIENNFKNSTRSTSRKVKMQTLSVLKRSPKDRKCKLNRRISML